MVSYFTVSVGIHFLPLRSSRALPFVVAFPLVNPSRDIFPMCPSGFVIIVSTLLDLAPRFWTWNALFRLPFHGGTLNGLCRRRLCGTRNGRSARPSVSLMNSYARGTAAGTMTLDRYRNGIPLRTGAGAGTGIQLYRYRPEGTATGPGSRSQYRHRHQWCRSVTYVVPVPVRSYVVPVTGAGAGTGTGTGINSRAPLFVFITMYLNVYEYR